MTNERTLFAISIVSRFLYVITLKPTNCEAHKLCTINQYQKRDVLTLFL